MHLFLTCKLLDAIEEVLTLKMAELYLPGGRIDGVLVCILDERDWK